MSIIEVQGTRSKNTNATPQGRERFEDKSESRGSHTPFYAAATLGALMLYLKESLADVTQGDGPRDGEPKRQNVTDVAKTADDPHVSGDAELRQLYQGGPVVLDRDEHISDAKHQTPLRTGLYASNHSGWQSRWDGYRPDSLDTYFNPISGSFGSLDVPMNFPAALTNDNWVSGSKANLPSGTGGAPDGMDTDETGKTEEVGTVSNLPPKTNHAPKISGRVLLGNEFSCTNIAILAAALLGNASDADADALSVKNVRINGVLLEQVNGAYTYHGEEIGPVVVNYLVSDGTLSVAATAEIIFVERPPIVGTDADDILLGTACDDQISGGNSNDRIDGKAGNDTLYGGCGNDDILGGDGNDVIYGDDGNDVMRGGKGNDILSGGDGNDLLFGGLDNDILRGESGHDTLYGEEGDDVLVGGAGRDHLYDGIGKDRLDGESGNDTVFASADAANDMFNGGSGINKLSYAAASASVVFDLVNGTVSGSDIGVDQVANFQVLQGGSGNDMFHAVLKTDDAPADQQVLRIKYVDPPADQLVLRIKYVDPPSDQPTLHIKHVDPPSSANEGIESASPQSPTVEMEQFMDHLEGDPANSTETPDALGDGGYTYLGGAGSDTIDYGTAQQTIVIDLASGTVSGSELATDHFASIECFVTGSGDDVFFASGDEVNQHSTIAVAPDVPGSPECDDDMSHDVALNAVNVSDGSGDLVSGVAANQHFSGGTGTDTLNYSDAEHSITFNTTIGTASGQDIGTDTFDGIERIVGGSGNDTFIIGTSAIVVDGEGGADVFKFVASTENAGAELSVTHIQGFEVGDLVRMSMYDLFDQASQGDSDEFADIYSARHDAVNGEAEPDLLIPIRIRIDSRDDHESTYIDADLDNNGSYEVTVQLDGNHHLMIVNNHLA
jgi:Ca2+-binding RTX toxin-like protein